MNINDFLTKLKNFTLKVIYCPQKIFVADNTVFFNARPTCTKNNMVAFNNDKCLKVEIFEHKKKVNNLDAEGTILKYLTRAGAIGNPKFLKSGKIFSGKKYMISEKIIERGKPLLADILLSVLEQQKKGVFHRDIKADNVIFDGTVAKLIDYDQAEFRTEMKELLPKDSIHYFITQQTPNWVDDCNIEYFGRNFDEALANSMQCFSGSDFNLDLTTLFKKVTMVDSPFHYAVKEKGLVSVGDDGIYNEIIPILNEIGFSENEKVLDCGCNTGTLSVYMSKRGCDVYSIDKEKNLQLCTKVVSNILDCKVNVFGIDFSRKNFPKKFDTILLLNQDFYSKFRLTKVRNAKKYTKRFIVKMSDINEAKKLKDYQITKIYPVEGRDFVIVILEKN